MGGSTATVRVRRSINSLAPTGPEIAAFRRGVAQMKRRSTASPTDPTGWTYQANMHGTYDTPARPEWNQCQHGSFFFLSWHRMYVYFFERILRAASGDSTFALPYWNYSDPAQRALPLVLRSPARSSNSLYTARRAQGVNQGFQLAPSDVTFTAAFGFLNFTANPGSGLSFGGQRAPGPGHFLAPHGQLESQPHDIVHDKLGGPNGLMSDPNTAARDPVFWLHHANIDRLWNRWLALGGGRGHPTDAAWRDQSFTLHDETGAQVTITVADVLDSEAQLGYRYDDVPTVTPAMVPVAPPSVPPRLIAATDRPLELAGSGDMVSLSLDTEAVDAFQTVFSRAGRAWVSVEDIDVESDPGLAYGVYLDTPSGRHHIGNVSLFGIDRMRDQDVVHDAATGFRHTFDVTDLLARLAGELTDQTALGMWFEPLRPEPPAGFVPEEEEPVGAIRIGRISLWVGPSGPDIS
jgi:Common central domain of tyrosinase/Polyphenol oxidase middle domain